LTAPAVLTLPVTVAPVWLVVSTPVPVMWPALSTCSWVPLPSVQLPANGDGSELHPPPPQPVRSNTPKMGAKSSNRFIFPSSMPVFIGCSRK
jgi:hypothetical protein